MLHGSRVAAAGAAALLALALFGQCRRASVAPPTSAAPAGPARAAAESPPPPPHPSPAVADAAGGETGPPPSKGSWLNGNIYRFRLDDVRPCPPALAGATRVGVLVRVSANIDELVVAPRDFKLETGGVILESAILQKAPAACTPLLAPKSLRVGKTADGVVVFDIPPGFNPEQRPVRIAYQPTRWGGARRVEAVLPPGSLASR